MLSTDDEAGDDESADDGSEDEEAGDDEAVDEEESSEKDNASDSDGQAVRDYAFEKEGDDIFDKNESDSEVEEFMEELENDEFEKDGLKLPSDDEEEEEESGPGVFGSDYGDEEDFNKADDYDDEQDKAEDEEVEAEDDAEDELEDVFTRANENQEMDVVENLRRQADGADEGTEYVNADLIKKIE